MLIVAGFLRLGFVSEFLARPVIVGFISGIGVVIIVGQLPKLLGLPVETGNVPETLWRLLGSLDEISWWTPVVGCVSLAALIVLRRLAPKVPWALVAVGSIGLSRALDLAAHGVAMIPDVPAGLPTPAIPNVGLGEVAALSGGALALALVALAESIGAARFAAVIGLVDVKGFRRLWQIDQGDARLAVVGFAAVALLGVLPGIVVAVIASLLALVWRAYRPRIAVLGRATGETSADEDYLFRSIDRHPEYETIPGLVLFRFSNELFFANAPYFRDETLRLVAETDPPARTVLVDASAVGHLDTTAAAMLEDLIDRLDEAGVAFELARTTAALNDALARTGLRDRIRPGGIHRSVHTGVQSFLARESR